MIKTRECYKEFSIHESLADAFSDERIPLLSMHQLRVKDYRITRKISYERTVSDFMMALNVNDSLRSLRNRQDIVVLLNEQGMLIREQGEWKLYFTPNKFERSTLADDAELYPVLESLDRKWEAGELAMSPVPYRSLNRLVANVAPFSILDEYCKSQPGQYLAVAEKIVVDGPDLELLSEIEHERWVKDKLEDGWVPGAKDSELKRSAELVPYAELEESTKEFIRRDMRQVPEMLRAVGYELYRKKH